MFSFCLYFKNPSIYDPDLEEKANLQFSKYNLDDRLLTELEDINIVTPTIIQVCLFIVSKDTQISWYMWKWTNYEANLTQVFNHYFFS